MTARLIFHCARGCVRGNVATRQQGNSYLCCSTVFTVIIAPRKRRIITVIAGRAPYLGFYF